MIAMFSYRAIYKQLLHVAVVLSLAVHVRNHAALARDRRILLGITFRDAATYTYLLGVAAALLRNLF